VLDVDGGSSRGLPLVRRRPAAARCCSASNEVKQGRGRGERLRQPSPATPPTAPNGCGKTAHPVSVSGAYSIDVLARARNLPSDDIVLKLIGPGGTAVASSDTGSSPGGP